MADPGFTVRETAQRLGISEPSVRRKARVEGPDGLEVVSSKPLRLSRESVDRARSQVLRRMGVQVDAIDTDCPTPVEESIRILALENRIRLLEGALADLTSAHSALLDTYRRLSDGAIPNN